MLEDNFKSFLSNPFPLWETSLTSKLVADRYRILSSLGISDPKEYRTPSLFNASESEVIDSKSPLFVEGDFVINLENPDFKVLGGFYQEQGLMPVEELGLVKHNAVAKLIAAIQILSRIPECLSCLTILVNCIQVINSDGPEYDVSYSHPDIPFTIFLSVCEEDSVISDIRVAEGILHEAMHLKLTLLEQRCPLIASETETYYSPWRKEQRPLRGVLHGAFVFKAILMFFENLLSYDQLQREAVSHLTRRISEIKYELRNLKGFPSTSLTAQGKALALLLTQC